MDGVEHCPEDAALLRQRPDRALLKGARVAPGQGQGQALVRIDAHLGQARAEVVEPVGGDPGVMALEPADPLGHQVGGE